MTDREKPTAYIPPSVFISDEETIKILEEERIRRINNRQTKIDDYNEKMIIALENAICTINAYMFEQECESTQ